MAVDPEHAVGRLIFEDTAYFFCTLACALEFAQHPNASSADSLAATERDGRTSCDQARNATYGEPPVAYPWYDKSRKQPRQRLHLLLRQVRVGQPAREIAVHSQDCGLLACGEGTRRA
jgi:YHS domain-containing protein